MKVIPGLLCVVVHQPHKLPLFRYDICMLTDNVEASIRVVQFALPLVVNDNVSTKFSTFYVALCRTLHWRLCLCMYLKPRPLTFATHEVCLQALEDGTRAPTHASFSQMLPWLTPRRWRCRPPPAEGDPQYLHCRKLSRRQNNTQQTAHSARLNCYWCLRGNPLFAFNLTNTILKC
jgi:hypothetical protein